MPVHTDKLLHLLGLALLSYWLVKYSIMSLVVSTESLQENFQVTRESPDVDKIYTGVTYRQFLNKMQSEESFRREFFNVLQKSRFKTYFFETPKVTKQTLDDKFEFILSAADELKNVNADKDTFQDYFRKCKDSPVITFPNLGHNAVLVVPCPVSDSKLSQYSSIGPFMRNIEANQVHQFWIEAARTMLLTIDQKGSKPTWMSTSGLGVYWLHLRWDYPF